MAHLFVPQPAFTMMPMIFNVDGVVGAMPAQNDREDVLYVQFAFDVIARYPMEMPSDVVSASKAVQMTGSTDAATINAIRVFQQNIKKGNAAAVVDGRVSPAKGRYLVGGAFFTIAQLNSVVRIRNREVWPRLDKMPGCHPDIQKMVIRTVVGTS